MVNDLSIFWKINIRQTVWFFASKYISSFRLFLYTHFCRNFFLLMCDSYRLFFKKQVILLGFNIFFKFSTFSQNMYIYFFWECENFFYNKKPTYVTGYRYTRNRVKNERKILKFTTLYIFQTKKIQSRQIWNDFIYDFEFSHPVIPRSCHIGKIGRKKCTQNFYLLKCWFKCS